MSKVNHYQILEVSQSATQIEIKRAYRRLVKRFHPDTGSESADLKKIVQINAAYEVLGDPLQRRSYDRQLTCQDLYNSTSRRQQRTADAQDLYQRTRQKVREAEVRQREWLKQVYIPINRMVFEIIDPLDDRIEELAADPFDDELIEAFESYLLDCRNYLNRAKIALASLPNPSNLASIAANLYYCLDRIGDGIDELEFFTQCFDDRYLHMGKELFRIARGLHFQARETANTVLRDFI